MVQMPGVPEPEQMSNSLPPGDLIRVKYPGVARGGWAFLDLTHTVYLYIETFFRRYTVKGPDPVVVWPHCVNLSIQNYLFHTWLVPSLTG